MSSAAPVRVLSPPGPPQWLPGGNFWAFRRNGPEFFTHLARTYGDIAAFKFGRQQVYLISRPEWIEDMLVGSAHRFVKGMALDRARKILGNGLLTANGPEHLKQRRTIQPLFHRQHVQGFASAMVRHATAWSAGLTHGARLDVTHEMGGLALAIVGETLFSSDVQSDVDEVREALADAVQGFTLAFLPFIGRLERLPLPVFVRMRRSRERLDRVVRRIIATRREAMAAAGAEPPALRAGTTHDLVSMLLAARDPDNPDAVGMSDEQIRDEAMTIFLAGHETTANAMAWTWHLLGSAPLAEARLHKELAEVLGRRTPTAEDVPKLEWARAIISESMRLFPPAWTMGRRVVETHSVGDYQLAPGSIVITSQYVAHRDPRWWDAPEQFKPERWLSPAPDRPKYTYFPFGGGSRICIGESFAWTEAILLLATIAQRWRLVPTSDPPPVPEPRITLRPKGLFMRAEAR